MRIKGILFPQRCIACGTLLDKAMSNEPFCEHCLAKWELAKTSAANAYRGQPTRMFATEHDERFGRVMFLCYYEPRHPENVENRFVFALKDHGDRRAIDLAARELAGMIRRNLPFLDSIRDDTVIAWIPRCRSAVRTHGFDHMERVARRLSRCLLVPSERVLRRKLFGAEQKMLKGEARRHNARSTMILTKRADLKNKTVILIDDIVTTGASLGAAAGLMINAGAAQVISAVLCACGDAEHDEYVTENGFNIIKAQKSEE